MTGPVLALVVVGVVLARPVPRPRRPSPTDGLWSVPGRGGADARVRAVGWRGVAVAVAVAALLVVPWTVVAVVVAASVGALRLADRWRAEVRRRRRRTQVVDELPDVVDLLRLAVGAGLTVRLAVESVARHGRGHVAAALGDVVDHARSGGRLAEGLERARSLGPAVDPLLDALLAAERYGTPLAAVLDQVAADARGDRRRRVEAEARKVPVRLLFPLVACVLPSVGLLTVVPVAAAALRGLSLGSG